MDNNIKLKEKYLEYIKTALKIFDFSYLDEEKFESQIKNFQRKLSVLISTDDDRTYLNFKSSCGATKGVLIFKNLSFVIKIPFLYCDGDRLCGANEAINNWDYCEQEAIRYQRAVEEGLEKVFLKTELLDWIEDYPIYIQEYANIFSRLERSTYKNYIKTGTCEDEEVIREICESCDYYYHGLPSEWEADLFANYGEDFFKKFMNYLDDTGIDDLRSTNVGYIGKIPVLVDYAGFNY